jgi:Tfp pilus assembly protein PilX
MYARIASQDGIAMPVATAVMLIMSILVATFFSVGLSVTDSANEDRNSKSALAAAEAGLQTAVYRLNQIRNPAVPAGQCLTSVPAAPVGGECPGQTEQVGNGASFTYYVTPELGAGGACVLLPSRTVAPTDRCITVVGTTHGVTRRIQARVNSQFTTTVFPFGQAGLVGKSLVDAWNSVKIWSTVGSNVHVNFHNSIRVNEDDDQAGSVSLLSPGGTYTYQNAITVDGGTHSVTTPFDVPLVDFEAVEQLNDNSRLPAPFNPTTRQLTSTIQTNVITISPGNYHLCGVYLGHSVKLKFTHAGNAVTRLYVDSPSRPGSFCAGQPDPAGTFLADNSVEINKEVGEREELLEIYLYGTGKEGSRSTYGWCTANPEAQDTECKADFMLDNSVQFYGTVFAPNSTVAAHNSVEIYGGIAADKIGFNNSVEFHLTNEVAGKSISVGATGPASRKGWTECRSAPTVAGNPESGC